MSNDEGRDIPTPRSGGGWGSPYAKAETPAQPVVTQAARDLAADWHRAHYADSGKRGEARLRSGKADDSRTLAFIVERGLAMQAAQPKTCPCQPHEGCCYPGHPKCSQAAQPVDSEVVEVLREIIHRTATDRTGPFEALQSVRDCAAALLARLEKGA